MTTFDEPDDVQGWESDSRRILGKRFGPKVYKSGLFSKAMVSVRVRVRVRGRRQLSAFCFKRTMFVWEGGGSELVRLEQNRHFWTEHEVGPCSRSIAIELPFDEVS